jgi:photosystem II stability/assembly factor-like uncharacterized protein
MKKILLAFLTALCSVFIIILISHWQSNDFHSLNNLQEEDEGEEHEDGVQKALFQEFVMTRDPSLNTVPTARMIEARNRMNEINNSVLRTGQTAQTTSLSWQERGPDNIGGRTRAILVDQTDATGNTVWAGGASGGLWKTTNFKTFCTWTRVDDFFDNLAISCIAQDPSDPQNIYFGTGEGWLNSDFVRGLGIWKYDGTNWSQLSSTNNFVFYYVEKIVVNTSGIVFAATRNGGIRKSSNGGNSWTTVLSNSINGGSTTRAADIEIAADGNIYASLGLFNSDGIYRSSDNGSTWSKIYSSASDEYRIELACAPGNADMIYALIHGLKGIDGISGNSDDNGIKKIMSTSDATAATPTWTDLTIPSWCDQGSSSNDFTRNQAWYDLIAAVDPNDDQVVYIGGVDILKTADGGNTWSQVTQWAAGCTTLPNVHADIHNIQFVGSSSTDMIVGCDGGVYYTTDAGASFTDKNTGYNVTQYYGVTLDPASGSNMMIAGAQDNGTHFFNSSGINSVAEITGGDGGFCFIDQTNSSVWLTSFPGSVFNLFRSNTYIGSTSDNSGSRFIDPADYDNSLNVLYYGAGVGKYGRLKNVESGAAGFSVKDISAAAGSRQVSAVKVDPNNASTVWFGCSTDGVTSIAPTLVKVTNADAITPSATAFAGPTLPANAYISSIDIESGSSDHMLLTVSNYGVASVWESADGGTTWTSLDNNGVNLPDMPVRWGIFIPGGYNARTTSTAAATGGIMLATELGVWTTSSSNGTSTAWTSNNTGLANVRVDQLVLRSSDKMVAAATHGRGLFTTLLLSSPLPVTLLNFDGLLQQKNILLEWTTSSEFNSSHFDLEKSFDGINFRKIATKPASGNSSSLEHYNYLDREPPSEMNYYRLKMVDENGHAVYSDIKLIRNAGISQNIYILGNPFSDKISFRFAKIPQTAVKIKLVNMEGKILLTSEYQKLLQQQFTINSLMLLPGNYVLQIETDQKIFNKQIVKQ